jgi:hypothetical protein
MKSEAYGVAEHVDITVMSKHSIMADAETITTNTVFGSR